MAFEYLDLRYAECFGWRRPDRRNPGRSWVDIAEASVGLGWNGVDVKALERDLAFNVRQCYFNIACGEFIDMSTDFIWRATFINDHAMWKLTLPKSPDTEVLPEDASAFFASEFFKKFAKRCADLIRHAEFRFTQTVEPHLDDGDLLEVQEEKLSRIMYSAGNKRFMENLRTGKYEM